MRFGVFLRAASIRYRSNGHRNSGGMLSLPVLSNIKNWKSDVGIVGAFYWKVKIISLKRSWYLWSLLS